MSVAPVFENWRGRAEMSEKLTKTKNNRVDVSCGGVSVYMLRPEIFKTIF